MATVMDGHRAARDVLAGVASEVVELGRIGFATVVVSDDPVQHDYAERKHAAARTAGIEPHDHRLPAGTRESDVVALVERLGADDAVDGIFVQLPLPEHVRETAVLRAVHPAKDVDGLHPENAGRLLLGDPVLAPATALAVIELLELHDVPLQGSRALVIGDSPYAAKATAVLLLAAHATVTLCEAGAPELARHLAAADVVVSAADVPGLVTAGLVKPGAAVLDAGLEGDVAPAVAERAAYLAPVPGGVGPLTIAMLLRNTVRAARYRRAAAP